FSNLRKGSVMTVAAITIIAITIFLVGLFLIFEKHLHIFSVKLKSNIKVNFYLKPEITDQLREDIVESLKNRDTVDSVLYISPETAFKELQNDLGMDKQIFDFIDENPLPPTLEVKLKETSGSGELEKNIKSLIEYYKSNEFIQDIDYATGILNRVEKVSEMLREIALMMIMLLVAAAFLIVFNAIKITVVARSEEIEIMKLVGATNWFIRWPFIIEGFLQGLFGAFFSCVVLYFVYKYGIKEFNYVLPFLQMSFTLKSFLILSVRLFSLGMIIGTISSYLAIRKFLKI
ncbi:permease-like cell division protein FtsX, partial [bacterium]|nr:permease-like cell division protein FtsX [bacterium]